MLEENLKKIYYIPVPVPPTSKTQQEGELNLFDLFTNPNPQSLVGPDIGGTTLPQIKQNTIQDQELALDDIRTNTLKSFIFSCSDGDCPSDSNGDDLNCCWANNTCQENYCYKNDAECTCNNPDGSSGGTCNADIDCSIGCLCKQFKTPCTEFSGCMYPKRDLKPGWGKYECTDPHDGSAFYLCDAPCGRASGSCSASLVVLNDPDKKYGIKTCDVAGNSYQYVETIYCPTLRDEYKNYWATNCGGGLKWKTAVDRDNGIQRCECKDTSCVGYDATDCWDSGKDNESLIMNIIGLSLACSQQPTSLCGDRQIGKIEDCENIIFYRDEQVKDCSELTCADLDAGLGKYCVLSNCTQCCGTCGTPCSDDPTTCCKTCGSECNTANDCTKYSQCLAKTGNYAPGGTCERCPCTDPCGSNCETSTKSQYDNCILNCQNSCCCTNPCVGAPTDYWTCMASSFGSKGCCNKNCDRDCGGLINSCSSANANCKKKISEGGCCKCAEDICATSTKNDYENCLLNVGACDGCCTDPCIGAPSNYFDCIVSPYAAKGCCSPFSCLDCGSSPCTDSHSQCNTSTDSGGCCVCKNTACKSTTNIEYNNCKKNADCIASGCCTDPCIGAPSNYFDCIVSSYAAKGCCSFSCSDCGSSPCTDSHSQCNTSKESGGCCVCKNSTCATSTKDDYENKCKKNADCIASGCCTDPCIGAPSNYFDCIVSPYLAKGCCSFSCSDCGSSPCTDSHSQCNTSKESGGCCVCKDSACKTNTVIDYNTCINTKKCSDNSCCIDPCIINGTLVSDLITSITLYDQCVAKTGIFSGLKDNTCCGSFKCSYCVDACTNSDIRCKNPSGGSDCCECNNTECKTNTVSDYANCLEQNKQNKCLSCCSNPCTGIPEITTVEEWRACKASETGTVNKYTPYTSKGCSCGEFSCTLCKPSACSNMDILCQATNCCVCNNIACKSTTNTEYNNCKLNTACRDAGCCIDPCIGAPSNYFDCIVSPYAAKGCCSFSCLDCGSSPCSDPHSQCNTSKESGGCCVCKNTACKSTTNTEYNNCKLNTECLNTGCCIDPCIGAPKDFNDCIRSPYLAKGCCIPPVGPCTECPYCQGQDGQAGTCSTLAEYNACLSSGVCTSNNCCIYQQTDPCDGCSDDCNTCRSNATCVAKGCCRFNCSQMTCPDSSTVTGYRACMNNNCCKTEGCCTYPCTGCPKNYSDCIKNTQCNLAGCCIYEPQPCDSCTFPTNQQCLQSVYCSSNGCCAEDPCFGCLDGSPNSYYRCMTNSDCRTNGCCGEAPCTLNKCFTSTKQEYLQCLNNPDCNDSEYPCCDNPCKTCSTNYFECMRNDACVRAGCCAIAPTCLDCKTDPAYPNASCTHPDSRCSNSPETGGCCNCKSSRCQTSTKSEYTTCGNVINKSFCKDIWGTGISCCSNPCTGCATKQGQFGLCITQSGCANKGCCTQPPEDPCAGCKQSNCSSIAECARNACCKETPICENCNATYATCITSPTCVANGCCPPDPCVRCNRNKTVEGFAECSADARCVANNCCNDPCDQCKHIYYTECSSDVYCSANNCCPPLPCPTCPENYEECISNEICRLYCCCVET